MMKIKATLKVLSALAAGTMAAASLTGALPSVAHETTGIFASAAEETKCGENITWSFNKKTGTLTLKGSGKMDHFAIEDNEDMTVAHTPWEEFKDSIKKVVIGKGITLLSECAFYKCSALEEVEGLTEDVIMEDSVFRRTPFFTNNVEKDGALGYLNNQLVDVDEEAWDTLTEAVIRPGTTSISTYYLCFCHNLTKVSIPEGVRYIFTGAFNGLENIESIELPESVEYVGAWAFYMPGLKSITVKNPDCYLWFNSSTISNDYNSEENICKFNGTIYGYEGSTAHKYSTYMKTNFESLGLPADSIANKDASGKCGDDTNWSFDSKTGTLTLSGNGNGMMYYYGNDYTMSYDDIGATIVNTPWIDYRGYIKTLKIEDGIKYIPPAMFNNYFALENVIYPENYVYRGDNYFWTPYYFNNIEIENGQYYLDNTLIYIDNNTDEPITELDIRPGTLGVSFYNIETIKEVSKITIPDGLKHIGNSTFEGLKNLETIELPESVDLIDAWAFCDTGLKSITIYNPDCVILEEEEDAAICNEFDSENNKRIYNGVIRGYKGSTAEKYAESNGYTFEALDAEPPSEPTNVKIDKNGKISWTASENADSYKAVMVVNGIDCFGETVTGTSYTFKHKPSSDYQIFIIAYGKGGTSAVSKAIDVIAENTSSVTPEGELYSLDFEVRKDGAYLTEVKNANSVEEVVIPEKTDAGIPVVGIDDLAFYNCVSLDKVVVPDTVKATNIGDIAFLTRIDIENICLANGQDQKLSTGLAYAANIVNYKGRSDWEEDDKELEGAKEILRGIKKTLGYEDKDTISLTEAAAIIRTMYLYDQFDLEFNIVRADNEASTAKMSEKSYDNFIAWVKAIPEDITIMADKDSDAAKYAKGKELIGIKFEAEEKTEPETHLRGDANGDGTVNVRDCAKIANALAFKTVDQLPCRECADYNEDGEVTVRDAAQLASFLASKKDFEEYAQTDEYIQKMACQSAGEQAQTAVRNEYGEGEWFTDYPTIISYTDRNNYEISVKIYIKGKPDTAHTYIFKNTNGKFSFEKAD